MFFSKRNDIQNTGQVRPRARDSRTSPACPICKKMLTSKKLTRDLSISTKQEQHDFEKLAINIVDPPKTQSKIIGRFRYSVKMFGHDSALL